MTTEEPRSEWPDAYRAYAAPALVDEEAGNDAASVRDRPEPVTVEGWIVVVAFVGFVAAMIVGSTLAMTLMR